MRKSRGHLLALQRAILMYFAIGILLTMFRGLPAGVAATTRWEERLPWIAWEIATWPRLLPETLTKAHR